MFLCVISFENGVLLIKKIFVMINFKLLFRHPPPPTKKNHQNKTAVRIPCDTADDKANLWSINTERNPFSTTNDVEAFYEPMYTFHIKFLLDSFISHLLKTMGVGRRPLKIIKERDRHLLNGLHANGLDAHHAHGLVFLNI